jgi:hypothetical protein
MTFDHPELPRSQRLPWLPSGSLDNPQPPRQLLCHWCRSQRTHFAKCSRIFILLVHILPFFFISLSFPSGGSLSVISILISSYVSASQFHLTELGRTGTSTQIRMPIRHSSSGNSIPAPFPTQQSLQESSNAHMSRKQICARPRFRIWATREFLGGSCTEETVVARILFHKTENCGLIENVIPLNWKSHELL